MGRYDLIGVKFNKKGHFCPIEKHISIIKLYTYTILIHLIPTYR